MIDAGHLGQVRENLNDDGPDQFLGRHKGAGYERDHRDRREPARVVRVFREAFGHESGCTSPGMRTSFKPLKITTSEALSRAGFRFLAMRRIQ